MKNLIIFLMFLLLTLSISITAQTFSTFEGAAENQRAYKPFDLRNFKPLSANEDTLRFTGVFHGQVVGGLKFVWLEDELAVKDKTTGKISRIYLCGNKGEFFSFPKKSIVYAKGEKGDPGPPGPQGPKGDKGNPGITTTNTESSFLPWWGWALLGGGVVAILAKIFWPNNEATTTGKGPGGETGPIFKVSFNF